MARTTAEESRHYSPPDRPDDAGGVDPTVDAGDRLCRLAARLLGVPWAIVAVRDGQRSRLVGRHGMPDDAWWQRSSLSAALAAREGEAGGDLRIDDVASHDALRDDPLHQELGGASILAVPIPSVDGRQGALCAISPEPRPWSDEDRDDLAEVAAAAAAQVILRGRRGHDASASHATWRSFVELVDGIDAVVYERDPRADRFLFVSRKGEELMGHPASRWTDEPGFFERVLLHPDDRERVVAEIRAAAAERRGADLSYRVRTADGKVIWVQDLVRPARRDGGRPFVRGVMVEVTRQKRAERELERKNEALVLLQDLAVRANESRHPDEPFLAALRRICEIAGWRVGHVYRLEAGAEGAPELAPADLWYPEDPTSYPGLRAASARLRFRRHDNLPGKVLASGLPEWVSRIDEDDTFVRREAALRAGLVTAFAFPVLAGREVAAVLEFFTDRRAEPDVALMELCAHVGAVLGRVVERERAKAERQVAERERARRETVLAETQRLAQIGSWEWDVAADRIAWSDQLHRIFGTDPATFDPSLEAYLRRLPPDDRAKAEDSIGRSMGTREPFVFDHRVTRPDGSMAWILSRGRVVTDEGGEVVRMVGTAQDITERREAESRERDLAVEQVARAEAEAAEERVRTILESISDAFFAMDGRWRLTYVNRATEELLGRPASKLVGQPLLEVFPDTPDELFRSRYERVIAEGEPAEFETYYPGFDAWYEIRAFPSEDGIAVYLHDITDRKRVEESLKASEARYRFLADSIPQQIWTASPEGSVDYVNKVVLDFFGVGAGALLGDGLLERVHPDDAEHARRRWARSVESGQPYDVEFRLRDAQGSYRWHLARAVAQRDREGDVVKWFGTNTYVHDQKEAEEERDRAMEELERVTHLLSSERTNLEMQARELRRTARALKRSNEDLDRFAYIASHDLKAPLRGIANLSAWLAEDLADRLDDDTEEYVRLLQGRVQRMEGLIDGILQYSRAGRTHDEPEEVDVGELVREVIDLLDPPPHFHIVVGEWWPVINTGRTPLHQVFLNLLGNAIKHADGEAPVVEVNVTDEGEGWYEYSVSDNGPGIAPEFHEKVFTIFQTLKPRDEVESTGIGLSVVKRIVDHHGGQVWIESREGEGATFKFLWPMNPKAQEDDRWTT